ncbi:MAG: phosphatidate cytidylyltransferase [Acholeplasmataceae bacterium]|jgi:phosphatidate cytidylyltransferase|nr:phosphatidate cytidylyltransferase [Acholeplasmataceae bacterium]
MKQRIITGAVLLAFFIPIFTINYLFPVFYGLMVLLTAIGAYEMLLMFNKKEKISPVLIIITILLTVLFYLAIIFTTNMPILPRFKEYVFDLDLNIVIIAIGFVLFTLMVFIPSNTIRPLSDSFTTIIYIGLSFSAITILRMMGIRFIIYLFLITMMTDMFAYFIGVKYGKHKIAPKTSPKKTVEGSIAGSIAGTVIASLFALFFDIYPTFLNPDNLTTIFSQFSKIGTLSRGGQALIVIPLTFFATCISQIGDLIASKFKRTYEIKDFGNIFPGHGGVVDRFDSAMSTAVFLLLVLALVKVLFPL